MMTDWSALGGEDMSYYELELKVATPKHLARDTFDELVDSLADAVATYPTGLTATSARRTVRSLPLSTSRWTTTPMKARWLEE